MQLARIEASDTGQVPFQNKSESQKERRYDSRVFTTVLHRTFGCLKYTRRTANVHVQYRSSLVHKCVSIQCHTVNTPTWKEEIRLFFRDRSEFFGNVSPRISRDDNLPALALMRGIANKRLIAAQKQYKYNYDKIERETPVFKTNELVFVVRPPLAMSTSSSGTMIEMTNNKLLLGADAPDGIVRVQQHFLTIDSNELLINLAMPASANQRNASVDKKNSIEREKAPLNTKYQKARLSCRMQMAWHQKSTHISSASGDQKHRRKRTARVQSVRLQ